MGTLGLPCGTFVHICTGEIEVEGSGLLAWEVRPQGGAQCGGVPLGVRAQTQGSLPRSCSKAL